MNKNSLDNKRILIIGILVFVLLALFIIVIKTSNQKPAPVTKAPANVPNVQDIVIPEALDGAGKDQFREEVPDNIQVPSVDTVLTEAEKKVIAVPTVVIDAAPGTVAQFRNFNISAIGGKFVPAQVIANSGDTIHVNFTAVDGDYDIVFPSYSMKQVARQGQTKILEFQAVTDGSFLYYCDACGGPEGPTTGKIIIVK